ncbi:F-box/LRR-repeat protein 4-like [Stegodyphus dumicola]|uniref:F-box/LRR-repeat protein 4-like n=1 Tax=Stegodyphus dumicola TaxID=202533 RepID=UPI0015AEC58F|nr:F-box/LRR-repeat protein 4-like [Stegodyphus dumicola]
MSLNEFPDEVLEHIFSFLNVYDRLTASLVSKRWLHLTDRRHLLEDIYVVFQDNAKDGDDVFNSMSRKFLCFKFIRHEIDAQYIEFLKKYITQIHSLLFFSCVLDRKALESSGKLDSFSNLKCLKIIGCDMFDLFSFSFPNLRELYVDSGANLTDKIIQDLGNTMPNLKVLSLACQITHQPPILKRFYPSGTTVEKNPSEMILSFSAVQLFISKRAETLTALDLKKTILLSSSAFIHLSKIDNLKLQDVTFACALKCIDSLAKFCENQPYLKSINLDCVYTLRDENLKSVCLLLPNLRKISIKHCKYINDSLKYIFQLKRLQRLDISGCCITQSTFTEAIRESQLTNLRALSASNCQITDIIAIELVQKTPYLEYLNLSGCDIGNETLKTVSNFLIHLKYLNLKNCMISDEGLLGKIQQSSTTYNNRDENMSKLLSNIKGLEELNLSGCYKITDASVTQAIQFQYLQVLNLEGCEKISDSAMVPILQKNPCLREVIRTNCILEALEYRMRDLVTYFTFLLLKYWRYQLSENCSTEFCTLKTKLSDNYIKECFTVYN